MLVQEHSEAAIWERIKRGLAALAEEKASFFSTRSFAGNSDGLTSGIA